MSLKNNKIVAAISLICLALALLVIGFNSLRAIVSYDAFWHLKMGEDLVSQGLSPWQDHYSFIYQGAPIQSPPVIFQVLLYQSVNMLGVERGFAFLRFSVYALALFAVFWLARKQTAQRVVFITLLPFTVALFQLRMMCRPEIVGYILIPLAFALYARAREDFSPAKLLPVALLLLFWVNYHNPVVGYVIIFGLFVDWAVQLLREFRSGGLRPWVSWLIWGLVMVGIGFAKPGMQHFLVEYWYWDVRWRDYIQEYLSAEEVLGHSTFLKLYWMVAACVTVWTAVRREIGLLCVCLILFSSAWTMVRLVPMAGLAAVCIAITLAGREDWEYLLSKVGRAAKAGGVVLLAFTFVGAAYTVQLISRAIVEEREAIRIFPTNTVDYMVSAQRDGRVFNEFETGGYLIYRRAPANTVYIDGRTVILYSFGHYQDYLRIANIHRYAKQAAQDFEFDHVLFVADEARYRLWQHAGFGLDFVGENFFLLSKEQPALLHSGELLINPWCWNGTADSLLAEEIAGVLPHVAPDSSAHANLLLYQRLIGELGAMAARRVNFAGIEGDVAMRVAARAAALVGDHDSSLAFLELIRQKKQKDLLAIALAQVETGAWDEAQRSLLAAIERTPEVTAGAARVVGSALRSIAQQRQSVLPKLQEFITDGDATEIPNDRTAQLCEIG